jgi:hypothetical protein
MDLLICHSCGTVLRGKLKACTGCSLALSDSAPTPLPTLTRATGALAVQVKPDPIVLERLLVRNQSQVWLRETKGAPGDGTEPEGVGGQLESNGYAENGNGHGNGDGHGHDHGNGSGSGNVSENGNGNGGAPAPQADRQPFDFAPSTAPSAPLAQEPAPAALSAPSQDYSPEPTPSPPVAPVQSVFDPAPSPVAQAQSGAYQSFAAAPAAAPTAAVAAAPAPVAADPAAPPVPWAENSALAASSAPPASGAQAAMQPPPVRTPTAAYEVPEAPSAPPIAPAAPSAPVDFFDSPTARQMNPGNSAPDQAPPVMPQEAPAPALPAPPPPAPEPAAARVDVAPAKPARKAQDLDFFAATGATAPSAPTAPETRRRAESFEPEPAPGQDRGRGRYREEPEPEEAFPFSEEEAVRAKPKIKIRPPVSRRDEDDDDDDFMADEAPKKSSAGSRNARRPAPSRQSRSFDDDDDDHDSDDDDHDDDETPKSKGKAQGKDKRPPSRGNHDDDDDDDETPPPRRSFSGASPTFKSRPPAKKDPRAGKLAEKGKSSGRRGRDGDDVDSGEKTNFLQAPVNVLGFSMKRQTQLIFVVVALVVLPMIFQLVGSMLTGLMSAATSGGGGVGGGGSAEPLMIGGDWKITFANQNDKKTYTAYLSMEETNGQIQGIGRDGDPQNGAPFVFGGAVTRPDAIAFNKVYQQQEEFKPTRPVQYFGKLDLQGRPRAQGVWRTQVNQGHFLTAKVVNLQGPWTAERIRAHVYHFPPEMFASVPKAGSPGSPGANQPMAAQQPGSHGEAGKNFLMGLLMFLGVAVGLVWIVWNLFGTNGIMSKMGKQQYIPSQYKGDHNKIKAQLAKPIVAGSLPLGTRNEWKPYFPWEKKELGLPPKLRDKDPHILVLGSGDKGKSRFIASMVTHDIESNDRAIVVIDSDGTLVDMLLRWISHHAKGKQFAKRVILLDPTNKKGSLTYNPLEMPEDEDLQSAASSLVYGFKAIYTEPPGSQSQWNAQTANILRNSALLLMANGKTLTDLPTLLQDNDFRDILLENIERKKRDKVEYSTLLESWAQYKKLARTDQWITWVEPILNRVTPMLGDPRIRPILTNSASDIKLSQVIKQKKILLVKVARGQLDENANLLGSLIVTGLKQAAMSLAGDGEELPSALYLDEFDDFIDKETLESITTETDRFQIGFVGSVKTLQHLPEDFRNQLVISVGTIACFALSKKDGDLLGPQMFRVDGRKIKHQTMSNFFNPVNTSPQFELISDEEKLNIDRVVGQELRHFFCYRVGSQAGVFHMKSHDFNDIDDKDVNWKLMERMQANGTKTADKERDA